MGQTAKNVLDAFESLPAAEREEVMVVLLRRAAMDDHEAPSDEELIAAADRVFVEFDGRETET